MFYVELIVNVNMKLSRFSGCYVLNYVIVKIFVFSSV